jgi:hypothetical protein
VTGDETNYPISPQISAKLESHLVKMLPILPGAIKDQVREANAVIQGRYGTFTDDVCDLDVELDRTSNQIVATWVNTPTRHCSNAGSVLGFQCRSDSNFCQQTDGFTMCPGSHAWASLRVLSDGNFTVSVDKCSPAKFFRRN